MALRIVTVDAFTDTPFSGNPAAVCVLPEPRDDRWMHLVAREMNLSETAFLREEDGGRGLPKSPEIRSAAPRATCGRRPAALRCSRGTTARGRKRPCWRSWRGQPTTARAPGCRPGSSATGSPVKAGCSSAAPRSGCRRPEARQPRKGWTPASKKDGPSIQGPRRSTRPRRRGRAGTRSEAAPGSIPRRAEYLKSGAPVEEVLARLDGADGQLPSPRTGRGPSSLSPRLSRVTRSPDARTGIARRSHVDVKCEA